MKYPVNLILDAYDLEKRGIAIDADGKIIRSRIGISLSLYFLRGWEKEKRQGMLDCVSDYLSFFMIKLPITNLKIKRA